MLTGWKDITAHAGYSVNTIKALMRDEGFPVQYVKGKPTVTPGMIEDWLRARLARQHGQERETMSR
ncbi:hypothetical protein K9F62_03100 [Desulfovibrio sp. JY]|nr:hypothetical protein K9F62_03100 [Desulfovibrio sp. JY]